MIIFSRHARLRVIAVSAIVALVSAASAMTNEYSCRVPRALLCEGCASQITIALQPGGSCRISFTAPGAEMPAAAKPPSDQVELRVEAAPVVITRFAQRRGAWPWRTHTVALVNPTPSGRCFIFNSQQYCE